MLSNADLLPDALRGEIVLPGPQTGVQPAAPLTPAGQAALAQDYAKKSSAPATFHAFSIYHRLFRLVTEIEGSDDQPQFQYIVTTTTRPPEDLAVEPWLRQTLRGSPGTERLLRGDL